MSGNMTSREILKRCIHFQDPPRFGIYFPRFGVDDTFNALEFFEKDEHEVDPWGITWTVHPDFPSIGIPKESLVENMADLDKIHAPDPKVWVAKAKKNLAAMTPDQRDKYRFVAASCGIWETPQHYLTMERIMEALVFEPELVHRLIKFCTDFWVVFLKELGSLKGEIDALYMFDDWGTQQGIMVSQNMWREFFAEPYRRITSACHANGMDFWLHSCGRVTNLIGDFIDAGMDVISPMQSGVCGYEEVAQRYAGNVAFLTSVDSQTTLTHGTPAQVLAECKRLEKWATPHGGLIASNYHYDTPEENERTVMEYFMSKKFKNG